MTVALSILFLFVFLFIGYKMFPNNAIRRFMYKYQKCPLCKSKGTLYVIQTGMDYYEERCRYCEDPATKAKVIRDNKIKSVLNG